jgi:hypothetical protein
MKAIIILILVALLVSCAHERPLTVAASDFHSPRIERELNFYVATHPLHSTNHFYVGPTKIDHGELIEALVYWKEERTILSYRELEADALHDIFAWGGHELKLDRDTVDTPEEIAGSNYLETHRQWVDWMEQCISRGKLCCVLAEDARRMFPAEGANRK